MQDENYEYDYDYDVLDLLGSEPELEDDYVDNNLDCDCCACRGCIYSPEHEHWDHIESCERGIGDAEKAN